MSDRPQIVLQGRRDAETDTIFDDRREVSLLHIVRFRPSESLDSYVQRVFLDVVHRLRPE